MIDQPKSVYWRPLWLRKAVLFAFMATFIMLALGLILIWHLVYIYDGIPLTLTTNHYAWTYGPTAVLTVIVSLWRQVNYCTMINQPWQELHNGPQQASKTVLLDYIWPLQVTSFITALKNRHLAVATTILIFVLLKLVMVISTTLFVLGNSTLSQGISIKMQTKFDASKYLNLLYSGYFDFGKTDSVWDYSILREQYRDVAPPVELSTAFTNYSITSNIPEGASKASTQVDIFQINVTCEVATVRWSQDGPATRFNLTLSAPSCEIGTIDIDAWYHNEICPPIARYFQSRSVHCGSRDSADLVDFADLADAALNGSYAANDEYRRVFIAAESDLSNMSTPTPDFNLFDIHVRRAAAVSCYLEYSINRGNAHGPAFDTTKIDSLQMIEGAKSRIDNFTNMQFLDAVFNSLTGGQAITHSSVVPLMSDDMILFGLLADSKTITNGTFDTLLDASLLQNQAEKHIAGFSHQLMRRFFLLPDNTASSGFVDYTEQKLYRKWESISSKRTKHLTDLNLRGKEVWIPFSGRWHAISLTIILPTITIVVLEILWYLSENNEHFAIVSSDSSINSYAIRFGLTAIALAISTLFSALDFSIATMSPFSALAAGDATPERTLFFTIVGDLPPVALYKAIYHMHLGAGLSLVASSVGNLLTVVVSGLWFDTAIQLSRESVAEVQSGWNISFAAGRHASNDTVNFFDELQHGGSDQVAFIWDSIVLPIIGDPQSSITSELIDKNQTLQYNIAVPAIQPYLKCTLLPQSAIAIHHSENGQPREFKVTALLPAGCNSYSSSNMTALICTQYLQSVEVNISYPGSLSTLFAPNITADVHLNSPPKNIFDVQSGSPSIFESIADPFSSLDVSRIIDQFTDFDEFFRLLTGDPWGIDREKLLGSGNVETLISAINGLYQKFMVHVIDREYRSTTGGGNIPIPNGGVVKGTVTMSISRLKINRTSKIILQAFLGTMVVFGGLAWWSVDLRVLPRNPYPIASTMALLGGSRLVGGSSQTVSGENPEQPMKIRRKPLVVMKGKRFRLGWWEDPNAEAGSTSDSNSQLGQSSTRKRFGIDVEDTDKAASSTALNTLTIHRRRWFRWL
ncbi:hypothetical protein EV127DRAFT_373032 [Xylaria flabelliformis]|nr:hypothetical protein EV127DRAFT_373032 [Xylaria flabelliformis]